jgi:serine/threonine-protein kinase RsbW
MADPAVRIEIPASGEYLAVLRAAATGLAAGLHFTYEEIDDLRIAVDEACAQLLSRRGAAETLTVVYQVGDASLDVEVTVPSNGASEPLDRDTFAWQILKALTDQVDERVDDKGVHLAFTKRGGAAGDER